MPDAHGEAGRDTMGSSGILHFVYNVDGTPVALAKDFVHRLIAPESYPCKLCDVTYGRFIKKAEWRAFVRTLPLRCEFHLRNAFRRRYPALHDVALPAILLESPAGSLRTLISSRELARVEGLAGLEALVKEKIASLGGPARNRNLRRRALG